MAPFLGDISSFSGILLQPQNAFFSEICSNKIPAETKKHTNRVVPLKLTVRHPKNLAIDAIANRNLIL